MPLPSASAHPGYLTIKQVAERCGVAYSAVWEWVARDRLIHGAKQLPNRMWLVPIDGLERFLTEHTEVRVVVPRRRRRNAA